MSLARASAPEALDGGAVCVLETAPTDEVISCDQSPMRSSTESPRLSSSDSTASIAAAAVERFADGEQCLHALVAAPRDRAVAREALSALSGSQAEAMLSYLAKWLTAYGDVPALARCAPHKRPLPRVPSLSRCIEWAGHVIDSHFAALALQLRIKGGGGGAGSASAVDTLRGLQGFVAEQVKAGRLSAPLPGALVHAQRAPRDAAADVAGSCPLYSVEVLEAPR